MIAFAASPLVVCHFVKSSTNKRRISWQINRWKIVTQFNSNDHVISAYAVSNRLVPGAYKTHPLNEGRVKTMTVQAIAAMAQVQHWQLQCNSCHSWCNADSCSRTAVVRAVSVGMKMSLAECKSYVANFEWMEVIRSDFSVSDSLKRRKPTKCETTGSLYRTSISPDQIPRKHLRLDLPIPLWFPQSFISWNIRPIWRSRER